MESEEPPETKLSSFLLLLRVSGMGRRIILFTIKDSIPLCTTPPRARRYGLILFLMVELEELESHDEAHLRCRPSRRPTGCVFCPIFYFFVAGFCLRFVEERLRVIANSPRRWPTLSAVIFEGISRIPLLIWIRLPTLNGLTWVERFVQTKSCSETLVEDEIFQSFGSIKRGFQLERDII